MSGDTRGQRLKRLDYSSPHEISLEDARWYAKVMDLETEWTWEEDTILIELRDYQEISFPQIANAIFQATGVRRTPHACVGRWFRIIRESEIALAWATRRARAKEQEDRGRTHQVPRDPYEPRPDWFEVLTPTQKRLSQRTAAQMQAHTRVQRPIAKAKPDPQPKAAPIVVPQSEPAMPRRIHYRVSWTED